MTIRRTNPGKDINAGKMTKQQYVADLCERTYRMIQTCREVEGDQEAMVLMLSMLDGMQQTLCEAVAIVVKNKAESERRNGDEVLRSD